MSKKRPAATATSPLRLPFIVAPSLHFFFFCPYVQLVLPDSAFGASAANAKDAHPEDDVIDPWLRKRTSAACIGSRFCGSPTREKGFWSVYDAEDTYAHSLPHFGGLATGPPHAALWGGAADPRNNRALVAWLNRFLRKNTISAVVDSGCGHWPTSWQLFVDWPRNVKIYGVDLEPRNIASTNRRISHARGNVTEKSYFCRRCNLWKELLSASDKGKNATVSFHVGDVTEQGALPADGSYDLLLTFDTLNILPSVAHVKRWLANTVGKFKYIVSVGTSCADADVVRHAHVHCNAEPHRGEFGPVDLAKEPYADFVRELLLRERSTNARASDSEIPAFNTVLRVASVDRRVMADKDVQLLDLSSFGVFASKSEEQAPPFRDEGSRNDGAEL